MSLYENDKYRIKRSASQEDMMQKVSKLLSCTYRDILVVSAVIGYNYNAYVPIIKSASDGVLMQFFTDEDKNLFNLIAYAKTGDQKIVCSDEKYEIFSSYANGGFPIFLNEMGISECDNNLNEMGVSEGDNNNEYFLSKFYSLLLGETFRTPSLSDELFKN